MLQTLADTALMLCGGGSAGITLLERSSGADKTPVFRWAALSGCYAALARETFATKDCPDAVTLELGSAQVFAFPHYYFAQAEPSVPDVVEELVVPIPGEPAPWGTLWVMSHDESHPFDNEHRRILTSLAHFTCAALTITRAKTDAEARAAEAEAARTALAAAEARKDDFIALLSHELRNPIAPVKSALAAAHKLSARNPAVLSALAVAERQMRQLDRLVSDLFDASRIRHGKLSVRPSYGLLQDIVTDAVGAVKPDAERRRHQLRTTVPPYPVTVYADHARLTQVVSNLLSNAVKYTPPGGEITLSVDAPDLSGIPTTPESSRRDAVIKVRDNGVGIAPSLLPRVFEMFTQAPSAPARAEGGLGIGLSVVKYLVTAHNGTVDIASAGEGQGTEVTATLPIVCQHAADSGHTTTYTPTPMRILLVDDNADATEALSILLTLDGHEVQRAQNGLEALSIVDAFTPDVALIDISMPGMDGYELAGKLRRHERCGATKLVAVTGYAAGAAGPGAPQSEFDCHLTKPLSLADLDEVLRRP